MIKGARVFTFGNLLQVGDKSTAHLKNSIILEATDASDLDNITLSIKSSILKFHLSAISKEVGTLKKLRWVVETASGEEVLELALPTTSSNRIIFPDDKRDLTAYLAFMPEDMVIKQGGKFREELVAIRCIRPKQLLMPLSCLLLVQTFPFGFVYLRSLITYIYRNPMD